MLLRDDDGAVITTHWELAFVEGKPTAVSIVLWLTQQRQVDKAVLDEAFEVFSKTIAMCDKLLSGQRREVKLVVADDPATIISSPSLGRRRSSRFCGLFFPLDAKSLRLSHRRIVLKLGDDLFSNTRRRFPGVLTAPTVSQFVDETEAVTHIAFGALGVFDSAHGGSLHWDVVFVKTRRAAASPSLQHPHHRIAHRMHRALRHVGFVAVL